MGVGRKSNTAQGVHSLTQLIFVPPQCLVATVKQLKADWHAKQTVLAAGTNRPGQL